jgi:predicted type IV restriction endonuclease
MVAGVVVGVVEDGEVTIAFRETTLGEVETDQRALTNVRVVNKPKDAQELHRHIRTDSRLRPA